VFADLIAMQNQYDLADELRALESPAGDEARDAEAPVDDHG
jgi:hypothetical protein